MRVAVLADIHGNLPALEAVLRDVEAAGVDAIVLNGDIADGPMPGQTLDRLEQLAGRVIWVRGNTDRSPAAAFDGTFQPSGLPANPPAGYFAWCAGRIGQAHRDRLASLPLTVTLAIDGLGAVAFCLAPPAMTTSSSSSWMATTDSMPCSWTCTTWGGYARPVAEANAHGAGRRRAGPAGRHQSQPERAGEHPGAQQCYVRRPRPGPIR